MKAIIIEDEDLAAEALENLLLKTKYEIHVVKRLESVNQAIDWFKNNTCDLIFSDINLGDGESFEIFETLKIKIPIIFTTAFDQFAIQSFQFFAIDYLLKPYTITKLNQAIEKFLDFKKKNNPSQEVQDLLKQLKKLPELESKPTQNRFLVSKGEELISINSNEIAFFMADNKSLFLFTKKNEVFLYDGTISSLEEKLSPKNFFKINRKFIISHSAIQSIVKYSQNRLKIELTPPPNPKDAILISSKNIHAFKEWLNN